MTRYAAQEDKALGCVHVELIDSMRQRGSLPMQQLALLAPPKEFVLTHAEGSVTNFPFTFKHATHDIALMSAALEARKAENQVGGWVGGWVRWGLGFGIFTSPPHFHPRFTPDTIPSPDGAR